MADMKIPEFKSQGTATVTKPAPAPAPALTPTLTADELKKLTPQELAVLAGEHLN